jgi:hypothetical protein
MVTAQRRLLGSLVARRMNVGRIAVSMATSLSYLLYPSPAYFGSTLLAKYSAKLTKSFQRNAVNGFTTTDSKSGIGASSGDAKVWYFTSVSDVVVRICFRM